MTDLPKKEILAAGIKLGTMDPVPPPKVDPAIALPEPIVIPPDLRMPVQEGIRWLPEFVVEMQKRLIGAEICLSDAKQHAESRREAILLRCIEVLDLLEDVAASLTTMPPSSIHSATKRPKSKRLGGRGKDSLGKEAHNRIELVLKRFRIEIIEKASVRLVDVNLGMPVDPERDEVLRTVVHPRLQNGTVVKMVKKAYYDELGGKFLRKAVVVAVGGSPATMRSKHARIGRPRTDSTADKKD